MKIELTEDEINAILDCICNQLGDLEDTTAWLGQPELGVLQERITFLSDLDMDIREQQAQRTDWDTHESNEHNISGQTFLVSESDFINAGTEARERSKELNKRLMKGTQTGVDIWSLNGLED